MAGVMTEQSREVWQSSKRLFFEVLICRGDTNTEAIIFSINCGFDVFYQHKGKLQSRLTTELRSSRGARKFPHLRSELPCTKVAVSLQAVTFLLCFRNSTLKTSKFSIDARHGLCPCLLPSHGKFPHFNLYGNCHTADTQTPDLDVTTSRSSIQS